MRAVNFGVGKCANGSSRYDALKKYIYQLEKQQANHEQLVQHDLETGEHSSLLRGHDASATDALFIPLLDKELKKIEFFYEMQEKDFFEELEELVDAVQKQEEADLTGAGHYADIEDEEEEEDDDSISRSPTAPRRASASRRPLAHSAWSHPLFAGHPC